MLKTIKDALESLGKPVFYGRAAKMELADTWDYIVFWRNTLNPSEKKTGVVESFTVALVEEEYVADDDISAVITSMKAIPGVRLANENMPFEYTTKPSTDTVLELVTLNFVRPKKGFTL